MIEQILTQTEEFWKDVVAHIKEIPLSLELSEQIAYLQFAQANKSVIYMFDSKKFSNVYISDNAQEVLGYKAEANSPLSMLKFFKCFSSDHLSFPLVTAKIYTKTLLSVDLDKRKSMSLTSCGMKFHHEQKGWIRILFQTIHLEMSEDQKFPLRSLVFVQDVTHLLKDDFYWTRITHGEGKTCVKSYSSTTKEKIQGDFISEREKDILVLLVQGKTTAEIAQTLFISPNTVNNHRQNILNKLGAKDTTALIHLARITGFV